MALQLEKLIFDVDTSKLKEAQTQIETLSKTVQDFNSAKASSDREAASAAREAAKAAREAEKANREAAKAAEQAAKAQQDSAGSTDAVTNKINRLNDTLAFLRNDLGMSETGFTKSQASIMAWAKSLEAGTDDLKQLSGIFDNFNRIMGEQALDKSVAGFNMINRQLKELQVLAELSAGGFNLTATQVKQLTRDTEALKQANIALGKAENTGVDELKRKYIDAANALNAQIAASKEMEEQAKAQAEAQRKANRDMNNEAVELFRQQQAMQEKMQREATMMAGPAQQFNEAAAKKQAAAIKEVADAEAFLTREAEKLVFTNEQLAKGFTQASANYLFKYKEALEKTGRTAEQVQKELAAIGEELIIKQDTSPFAKMQKDIEQMDRSVNHLARNLSVQFTDIFVSLANGQSLFQVITQQGGQIADAFMLAGDGMMTAKEQAAVLVQGLGQIVESYKTVALAFTELAFGAVVSFGQSLIEVFSTPIKIVIDRLMQITGLMKLFGEETAHTEQMMDSAVDAFKKMQAFQVLLNTAIGTTVAVLGTLAIALISVTEENAKLNRELTLYGASLGLTEHKAIGLAESFREIGKTASEGKEILGLMARQGGFTSGQFELIGTTISDFAKVTGIALDDVIKRFSEVNKDPVKALSELQIAQGNVSVAIQEQVNALVQQGDKTQAAKLAMEEFNRAVRESANDLKESLPWYKELWNALNSVAQLTWDSLKQFVGKSPLDKQLESAKNYLEVIKDLRGGDTDYDVMAAQAEVDRIEARIRQLDERAKSRQKASTDEEDRRKTEDWINKAKIEALKPDAKKLSLQQYINQAVDYEIKQKSYLAGSEEALALIRTKAAEDWEKANESRGKKEQSYLEKAKNAYQDILNKAEGRNKQYNDSIKYIDYLLDKGQIDKQQHADVLELLEKQQPWYVDQEKRLQDIEKRKESILEYEQQSEKALKQQSDEIAKVSTDIAFKTMLLGKEKALVTSMTIEYEKQQEIKSAELKYEEQILAAQQKRDKQRRDALSAGIMDEQTMQELFRIQEVYSKEVQGAQQNLANARINAEQKANYKISKDFSDKFEEVSKDLSDVVMLALTGKGHDAAKKLREMLKAELMKPIQVFVNAVVNTVLGSVVQGATGSAAGSLAGSAGSSLAGSMVGNMSFAGSTLAATGSAFTTGVSAGMAGADLSAAIAAYESAGMSGVAAGLGAGSSVGAGLVAAAPYLAAAAAIYAVMGETWGGDPDAFLVQGAAGNTNPYKTSTTTAFGQIGFATGKANIKKNGKMISEYGETQDVSEKAQKEVLAVFDALDKSISDALSQSQVAEIAANLAGWYKKSWSFEGKMLDEWIASRYEVVLKTVDSSFTSFKDFQKEGEKLTDTVIRLISGFQTVKAVFTDLGVDFKDMTYAMSSSFVEAFGSVDKFASATSSYYSNFYSEQEKTANTTRKLTEFFADFNQELPTTKEGFRAVVETAISAGDSALFARLMSVQQAFNDLISISEDVVVYIESIEEAYYRLTHVQRTAEDIAQERIDLEKRLYTAVDTTAQAADRARNAIDPYNRALYDQVLQVESMLQAGESYATLQASIAEAENQSKIEALNTQLAALEEQKASAESLIEAAKSLKEYVRSLRVSVESSFSAQQRLTELYSIYKEQTGLARSGNVQAFSDVQGTASSYLELTRSQATTIYEYNRVFAQVSNELDAIADVTKVTNESIVDVLKKQTETLEARIQDLENTGKETLQQMKLQLEQMKLSFTQDFENTIKQLDALGLLEGLLEKLPSDLASIIRAMIPATPAITGGGYSGGGYSGGGGGTNPTGNLGISLDALYGVISDVAQHGTVEDKVDLYQQMMAGGMTENQAVAAINAAAGPQKPEDIKYLQELAGYAKGGNYSGGLALVGEEGPELINFGSGGYVHTATQTAGMIANGNVSLIDELKALREEVVMLRAEVRADVSHNAKTAKLLDRVIPDGQSVQVTALA